MRRVLNLIAILSLLFFSGVRANAADYVPGEVVVQLQPGVSINLLCNLLGLRLLGQSAYAPVYRLGLPAINLLNPLLSDVETLVAYLRVLPGVVAADPNLTTGFPDSTSGTQWSSAFVDNHAHASYDSQPSIAQVNYQPSLSPTGGAGVTVAVLDTGISSRHAFLAAQLVPGWNFTKNNANTDDVPTGVDSNGDGKVDGGVGHGTMCAGIVYRFAPQASLMPIKVLDSDGTGTLWNVVEGIRFATAKGATVLNVSIGCPRNSPILSLAIADVSARGSLVIAAAGNSNSTVIYSPAGQPTALTVAALNSDNTKASFSNFGFSIDVDAPGVNIVSTYWDGNFAYWSGTSFAAPMVTGEAALIRSLKPSLSVSATRSLIISTSTSVNQWNPNYYNQLGKNGAGLINIGAALGKL